MPDRLIKESSCISDTLNALSDFGERFWWRLTVNCDDYGRCDARPAVLKSKLFPLADDRTPADMTTALNELSSVGLVTVYAVESRPYLQIVTWGKHQRIRAKRSKFPAPEDGVCCQMTATDSECPRNPIQSKSNPKQSIEAADEPPVMSAGFEKFWSAYPKKVGKKAAKKAFDRVRVPVETLLTAVERQKCSAQWSKDNGQYIPNPATWLNQGRWEDELDTVPGTAPSDPVFIPDGKGGGEWKL